MIVATFIGMAILLIYVVAMLIQNKGIPESISETYYSLDHKWWFSLTLIVSGMLTAPMAFDRSTESTECLVWLWTIGQLTVSTAPQFKEEQRRLHITGATMLLVFSQVWIGINEPYVLLSWVAYVLTLLVYIGKPKGSIKDNFERSKPLFWIEVISFINIYVTLLG